MNFIQTLYIDKLKDPFKDCFGWAAPEYHFSHIPTDSGYLAKVVLTEGLHTNYKKQIQYREGLTAQGEIITKDRRLLQRFYDGILNQVR